MVKKVITDFNSLKVAAPYFHVVFCHFAQIVLPPHVDPIWETLNCEPELSYILKSLNFLIY